MDPSPLTRCRMTPTVGDSEVSPPIHRGRWRRYSRRAGGGLVATSLEARGSADPASALGGGCDRPSLPHERRWVGGARASLSCSKPVIEYLAEGCSVPCDIDAAVRMHVVLGGGAIATPPRAGAVLSLPQPRGRRCDRPAGQG
jgi:hypothetical protein